MYPPMYIINIISRMSDNMYAYEQGACVLSKRVRADLYSLVYDARGDAKHGSDTDLCVDKGAIRGYLNLQDFNVILRMPSACRLTC